MKIGDLMTTDVITVGPETPLKEAARRMIEAGISGLPVTTEDARLIGIITEADFVESESYRRTPRRAGLLRWFTHDHVMPANDLTVGDIMTSDVMTLPPEADHTEAARLMHREGVKRIPIVDDYGDLAGVLSRADLLRVFARPDAEILQEVNEHLLRKILWIDPRRVDVSIDEGNIVLQGHLEVRSDAELLVELVSQLDGVVTVKDALTWETDNTRVNMTSPPAPGPNW